MSNYTQTRYKHSAQTLAKINELIARAPRDTAALNEFMSLIVPWVNSTKEGIRQRLCRQKLGNEAADDIVQDVLSLLHKRLKAGEIKNWGKFNTGYHGDIEAQIRSLRRKRKRDTAFVERLALHEVPATSLRNDAEAIKTVTTAMQTLSREELSILEDKINNTPFEKIGHSHSLSRENARQTYHTAIKKITAALQDVHCLSPLEKIVQEAQQRAASHKIPDEKIRLCQQEIYRCLTRNGTLKLSEVIKKTHTDRAEIRSLAGKDTSEPFTAKHCQQLLSLYPQKVNALVQAIWTQEGNDAIGMELLIATAALQKLVEQRLQQLKKISSSPRSR